MIQLLCVAFFSGLIWAEVKQLWDEGTKAYVQDLWNILDFITNALYIATFTLKLVAYLRVSSSSVCISRDCIFQTRIAPYTRPILA